MFESYMFLRFRGTQCDFANTRGVGSVTMRAAAVIGVALVLSGCSSGKPATRVVVHGKPPAWMLPRARLAARGLGDAHPQKIELFARGKSYRIRLWGRFRCDVCSRPFGAKPPTGKVATYVYRGHSTVLSSFSLSPQEIVVAANETAPVVREWRAQLAKDARLSAQRFPSPPVAVLRKRLDAAARRYGFTVDLILMRKPRQLAPQIVLRSSNRLKLAKSLGPIMNAIDPPPSNRRAYEGILIVAVDEHHVPFAIAWNALRGGVAGGQWASSPDLYPFPHG